MLYKQPGYCHVKRYKGLVKYTCQLIHQELNHQQWPTVTKSPSFSLVQWASQKWQVKSGVRHPRCIHHQILQEHNHFSWQSFQWTKKKIDWSWQCWRSDYVQHLPFSHFSDFNTTWQKLHILSGTYLLQLWKLLYLFKNNRLLISHGASITSAVIIPHHQYFCIS